MDPEDSVLKAWGGDGREGEDGGRWWWWCRLESVNGVKRGPL